MKNFGITFLAIAFFGVCNISDAEPIANFTGIMNHNTNVDLSWSLTDAAGSKLSLSGTVLRELKTQNADEIINYSNLQTTYTSAENSQFAVNLSNSAVLFYKSAGFFHDYGVFNKKAYLSGVKIDGLIDRGHVDFGINFDELIVDGFESSGHLDYSSITGFTEITGSILAMLMRFNFGNTKFLSTEKNTQVIFNENSNEVITQLRFGNLDVVGSFQKLDQEDIESDEQPWNILLNVQRHDKTALNFTQSDDLIQARRLFAFLQIMLFPIVDSPDANLNDGS